MNNLILSVAVNYGIEDLSVFVKSLKKADFRGRTVFFVDKLTAGTVAFLNEHNIETIDLPESIKNLKMSIVCLRYFLFSSMPLMSYDNIMLTDSRDVAFQDNPFSENSGLQIGFYLEDESKTIGSCVFNSMWVSSFFGDEILNYLAEKNISCNGVVSGKNYMIQSYLSTMLGFIMNYNALHAGIVGDDQAIHNYILWKELLPGLDLIKNGEGDVITCGYMKREKIYLDKENRITDKNGRIIPVVHQYDRHPDIEKLFRRTYS